MKKGVSLLLEFGLEEELELANLDKVIESNSSSLIGIWSLLDFSDKYPFNKNEMDLIKDIRNVGEINGMDIKNITESYAKLLIKRRQDINIDSDDIMQVLHKGPDKYLSDIYESVEREILYRRLKNDKDSIIEYISLNYS